MKIVKSFLNSTIQKPKSKNLKDTVILNSNKFVKSLRNDKRTQLITVVIVGVLILIPIIMIIFSAGNQSRVLEQAGLKSVNLEIYKSRNSRDDEKVIQSSFSKDDPIQVKVIFSAKSEQDGGGMINFNAFNKATSKRESGLFSEPLKIPLKDSGERYVTIPSGLDSGEYAVEIWNEKGETISSANFKIQ